MEIEGKHRIPKIYLRIDGITKSEKQRIAKASIQRGFCLVIGLTSRDFHVSKHAQQAVDTEFTGLTLLFVSHLLPCETGVSRVNDTRIPTRPMPSDNPFADHDFRIVHPPDEATYGLYVDFDPTPVEPDPRIYPLWYDKGNIGSDDLAELTPMFAVFDDTPTVVWISPGHYEGIYQRQPNDPPQTDLDPRKLPPQKRPGVTLHGDLKRAAEAIVRLWNGEFVNGEHLIADKAPRPEEFLSSASPTSLDPLQASLSENEQRLRDAFGEYPWFDVGQLTDAHLQMKHILRRKVAWAPTQKGKTMLHRHPDLPRMSGDTFELLPHRFGVGTISMYHALFNNAEINTYVSFPGGYNVDVTANPPESQVILAEMVTGHHKMDLHLSTFQKLWTLSQQYSEFEPWLVFDSRSTLRWILDYWLSETGLDPGPSLNSEPQLDNFNDQLRTAYDNPNQNWEIAHATTTGRLWRQTFDADLHHSRDTIKSVSW